MVLESLQSILTNKYYKLFNNKYYLNFNLSGDVSNR